MRAFEDHGMKGWAMMFDGPLELVELARAASENNPAALIKRININWPGRRGHDWSKVSEFLRSPWPEATKLIRYVTDGIMRDNLPQPASVKRRPRWNEDEGDVDVDRLLGGEPEYMRQMKRGKSTGPTHVALIGNLDAGEYHNCNSSGVWFRSAACIALADILENLGYTVEIWVWNRGESVYPEPLPHQFIACRPKAAGEPVDIDALCDTMSSWFTTNAIFAAMNTCPVKPKGIGYLVEADHYELDPEKSGIGGWYRYLQIGQDVIPISVPVVTGWNVQNGLDNAREVCRQILTKITENN